MNKEKNWWVFVIILVALGGLIFIFRKILLYMVLAAVVGFIGDPIADLFQKFKIKQYRIPRWLAAILTMLILLGFLFGLIILFTPLIRQEIAIILALDPVAIEYNLQQQFPAQMNWLTNAGYNQDTYAQLLTELQSKLSFNNFSSLFGNAMSWVTGIIGGFFSVLFMSFFFLKDEDLFYKILLSITPDEHVGKMKNIVVHTKKILSRYFGGLVIQISLMIVMIGIGLSICGVPNAWLIAVFSGIMNVIPYLGPLISFGFALVIGLSTGLSIDPQQSLSDMIWGTILVYAIAQSMDAFLIQPLILGGSIQVHPLELFIVLMAAATVGGIPAMAIALPVYTILRIAAREWFIEFKWVKQLTKNME
jgi:predicted PurR-regulated permease PerM